MLGHDLGWAAVRGLVLLALLLAGLWLAGTVS